MQSDFLKSAEGDPAQGVGRGPCALTSRQHQVPGARSWMVPLVPPCEGTVTLRTWGYRVRLVWMGHIATQTGLAQLGRSWAEQSRAAAEAIHDPSEA